MTGFCTECGHPLKADEHCPVHGSGVDRSTPAPAPGTGSGPLASTRDIGPLPKASPSRRLLGSGIEYVAYLICVGIITLLDAVSAGLFGLLSIVVLVLIVLRDFNAGAFSLSKRVSQMRVVTMSSGKSASNAQALIRNGYYLVLLALSAALPWIDWITSILFMLFVILDVMMILASPKGRRLGDLLAGTQVVEARS
jgi:uncharacterized RDD family membrane protein YckC